MKKWYVGLFLMPVLVLALAGVAFANNTTYDPASTTIEKTQPFTQGFDLKITSPTNLVDPFPSEGVVTDILITSTAAPDGV
jgi:hypothetical protein